MDLYIVRKLIRCCVDLHIVRKLIRCCVDLSHRGCMGCFTLITDTATLLREELALTMDIPSLLRPAVSYAHNK
jgi:hypothetical protein